MSESSRSPDKPCPTPCSCGFPRLGCLGRTHASGCKSDCPFLAELQNDAFVLREIAQCSALSEGQKAFLRRLADERQTSPSSIGALDGMPTDAVIRAICKYRGLDAGDKIDRADSSELWHIIQRASAPSATGPIAYLPSQQPDDGQHVLVFNRRDLCWYTAYVREAHWYHACGDGSSRYEIRSVTHWMPLPSAPADGGAKTNG